MLRRIFVYFSPQHLVAQQTDRERHMSAAYITCKVLPGLFENEYYVMVNGSSAYYVSRESVVKVYGTPEAGKPVDGLVLGYIVESSGGKTLVQLPGEAALGGMRTWVESEAVSAA